MTQNSLYRHNHFVLLFEEESILKYESSGKLKIVGLEKIIKNHKLEERDLKASKTIFYSPIYDFNENHNHGELINVSSDFLLENDQKGQNTSDPLRNHRLNEIERILNCIRHIDNGKDKYFDKKVKLPDFVEVSFEKELNRIELDDLLTPSYLIDFYNQSKEKYNTELSLFDPASLTGKKKIAVNSLLYRVINLTISYINKISTYNIKSKEEGFDPDYEIVAKDNFLDFLSLILEYLENFMVKMQLSRLI